MREAVLSLINYGICEESSWPYLSSELTVRPPTRCYKEGLKYQVFAYKHLHHDLFTMKNALHQGYPFAFAIKVYESFEHPKTFESGIVPIPNQ